MESVRHGTLPSFAALAMRCDLRVKLSDVPGIVRLRLANVLTRTQLKSEGWGALYKKFRFET